MNADNYFAGLFLAHLPFASQRCSFLDCLMARCLEGKGPVPDTLFRVNPFKEKPPAAVRMRTFLYQPAPGDQAAVAGGATGGRWWVRRDCGPQRPVMTAADCPGVWAQLGPEPELWHWDALYWRQRCSGRMEAGDGGAAAAGREPVVAPEHPEYAVTDGGWDTRVTATYDGKKLVQRLQTRSAVTAADTALYWSEFIPAVQRAARPLPSSGGGREPNLTAVAAAGRAAAVLAVPTDPDGGGFTLGRAELITARLALRLCQVIQPLAFAKTAGASVEADPSLRVGSFNTLSLLCHHAILLGEHAYLAALRDPTAYLARALPQAGRSDRGGAPWCGATGPAGRSAAADEWAASSWSGLVLPAVFRHETLCLHATKFRLNARTAAPNNVTASVPGSGFLELVDELKDGLPLPVRALASAL